MNEEEIKIVPNLYEAPSSPVLKDCYYNIIQNKYYIYDGNNWLEVNVPNEEDLYKISYSTDGGSTFITTEFNSYSELINGIRALSNRDSITDVSFFIGTDFSGTYLIPRIGGTSLDEVAVLTLNGEIIGKIYPKIIYNKKLVQNLIANTVEQNTCYFNNVLVYYKPRTYWDLTYIDSNNNTETIRYYDYENLKTFIQQSTLDFRQIDIEEGVEE